MGQHALQQISQHLPLSTPANVPLALQVRYLCFIISFCSFSVSLSICLLATCLRIWANLYTQLWNAGYGMRNDWFLNLNVWGKSVVKPAEADRYMLLTFLDILLYKHQLKSRHTQSHGVLSFSEYFTVLRRRIRSPHARHLTWSFHAKSKS